MKEQSRKPSNPYDPYGSENSYSPYARGNYRSGAGFAAGGSSNYGPSYGSPSAAQVAPVFSAAGENPYAIGNNGFAGKLGSLGQEIAKPTEPTPVNPTKPTVPATTDPTKPVEPTPVNPTKPVETAPVSPSAPIVPTYTPPVTTVPTYTPPTYEPPPVDTPAAPPVVDTNRPSGATGPVFVSTAGPAPANPTTNFSPLGSPAYTPAPVNPAAQGAPALANVGTDPNAYTRDQWSSAMFNNAAMAMEGNTGAWDQNQMIAALLRDPSTGRPNGAGGPVFVSPARPVSSGAGTSMGAGPRGGVV